MIHASERLFWTYRLSLHMLIFSLFFGLEVSKYGQYFCLADNNFIQQIISLIIKSYPSNQHENFKMIYSHELYYLLKKSLYILAFKFENFPISLHRAYCLKILKNNSLCLTKIVLIAACPHKVLQLELF